MNIKVDYWDNMVNITDDSVNVIEIENKKYFFRFINHLNEIINNGYSDSVIFLENDNEKNMNGKIKLFIDYFNLDFDSKKQEKYINRYINDCIGEEDKNNLISQYNKIVKIYNRILNNIDLPLVVENKGNVETITKLLQIVIDSKNELLENLLLIIELEKTFGTNNVLFFVNLKQYLSNAELVELYKYSIYNQINIVLVDSQAYGCTIDYEKKLIIDENLDEFVV